MHLWYRHSAADFLLYIITELVFFKTNKNRKTAVCGINGSPFMR